MLEPAAGIIERLGGATKVAAVTGAHRSRVSSWRRPKAVGGTGGLIPQRHHVTLLDFARRETIPLRAEDFLASSCGTAS